MSPPGGPENNGSADCAAAACADACAKESALAAERERQKQYWQQHTPQAPTVETMMLDSKASEIDKLERPEVLALLGSVEGKRVVELGAGIGRFTGELAKSASHVVALDFMEASIVENRRLNGHLNNIDFRVGDATELQLDAGCCDVVFTNWLLMYLGDAEVAGLAANMLKWTKPGGCIFFRESCFRQSGDKPRADNPTHYRNPREYFEIFDRVEMVEADGRVSHLELSFCKCIDTYVRVKGNQGQVCWKWTKVVSDAPRGSTFRHFLDANQYSTRSIARYERVFGPGFISCGGEATARELSALLKLQAGERVMDVGCGAGGSTYLISTTYGVHCHGLDLSVNNILTALERASARGGADVSFEVADCTTRDYPEQSYDAVHVRDVLLHVANKAELLATFFRWLRPGGRLLITDYCLPESSESEAPALSDEFKTYISSRQYSLFSIGQYKEALAAAGFQSVSAEDRTAEFQTHLQRELSGLEASKSEFVSEFSEDEFNTIADSWRGKLARAASGEQRWGLFTAVKPAAQ